MPNRRNTRNSRQMSPDTNNSSSSISSVENRDNVRNFNINIQNFDGDPSMVEFFFSQLEDVVKFNGYTQEQGLALLRSKLTASALKFYINNQELKDLKSVTEAKSIISQFFSPSCVKVSASELHNITILPNESIKNLAHRINNLACQVYPQMQNESLNQIKYVQLVAALPADLKYKIYKQNINTYVEAIAFAQNCQDAQLAAGSAHSLVQSNHLETINALKGQIQAMQYKSNGCQLCESSEHTAKFCEKFNSDNSGKLVKGNSNRQNYERGNVVQKSKIICQFCEKPGHILKNCWKFKKSRDYSEINVNRNFRSSGFDRRTQRYRYNPHYTRNWNDNNPNSDRGKFNSQQEN